MIDEILNNCEGVSATQVNFKKSKVSFSKGWLLRSKRSWLLFLEGNLVRNTDFIKVWSIFG